MTTEPIRSATTLTLDQQLDLACDRFEAEWKAGNRPSIERAIDAAPPQLREALLRELLSIELAYIRRIEGAVDLSIYRSRFASALDWIADLLAHEGESTDHSTSRRAERRQTGSDRPDTPGPDSDRFHPISSHAKGGLGEVLVALDAQLHRRVALKRIQAGLADDPMNRARFMLEAEITGSLEHPGIVPVYGLGIGTDGRPYYAMRFIQGDDLHKAIRRFHDSDTGHARNVGFSYWANPRPRAEPKPASDVSPSELVEGGRSLAFRALIRRFLDACNAIAYAHSRASSIATSSPRISCWDRTARPWWSTGALAKFIQVGDQDESDTVSRSSFSSDGMELTLAGSTVGTPAYMSPEQAEGRLDELGPRSDVYSLGATLYVLLTGRPPFQGPLREVIEKVVAQDFPAPRSVNPRVPRALEAVCLKAMSARPDDRYADPRALADDVERWLADEPVTAWPEPLSRRVRRWVSKHRTLVSSASVGLLALLLGVVAYTSQRLAAARGRVEALRNAEIRTVPGILQDLGTDRRFVRGALHALIDVGKNQDVQLRGLLALVQDEPERAGELTRRMLLPSTRPDELLVIRQAVGSHAVGEGLTRVLAMKKEDPIAAPTDEQLRALAALSLYDPTNARWNHEGPGIAAKLSRENPLFLDAWREAFQPVAQHLVPPLRAIYANRSRPEERDRAAVLLLEFASRAGNPNRAQDLAALIPDADPARLDEILRRASSEEDRARLIGILTSQIEAPAKLNALLSQRQGRIAATLFKLGVVEPVWALFRFQDDPSTRTEVIHDASEFNVPAQVLTDRLQKETDPSASRALLLALGSYPIARLPESDRQAWTSILLDWYRNQPDAGIHGAVAWVLGARWGHANDLRSIDRELAGQPSPAGRAWTINKELQTYSFIRDPGEFRMGSTPEHEPEREPVEAPHLHTIPRSFAAAAREVTVEEYGRFLAENPNVANYRKTPQVQQLLPHPDGAMGAIDFYDAARYCNWLSQKDGLPEAEWCYPREPKEGMALPEDHLQRKGYRLPTEGEWEFMARAGTVSKRSFGCVDSRISEYGWYVETAGRAMNSTGQLKPNDLGLFDTLGNATEWCVDPYGPYPAPKSLADQRAVAAAIDAIAHAPFGDRSLRVIRGGSYGDIPANIRSGYRGRVQPSGRYANFGIRPVRTLP
ncbi:MAG: bifunctional serine/threonine-protein kinase/formylglycine-generating enzyme family protein [Isosphaeraceae bacterium]